MLFLMALVVMLIGLAGTFLPAIPGTPVVFAAAFVFAVITDFEYIDSGTIGIFALLTGVSVLLDWAAATYGVKKMGGSWLGVLGAFVGMVVGLLIPGVGIIGFIVGAFLGAVAGELIRGRTPDKALLAGTGSFLGFIAGGVVKFTIAAIMIGWFAWAVLV